jgi:hypothetical protein
VVCRTQITGKAALEGGPKTGLSLAFYELFRYECL